MIIRILCLCVVLLLVCAPVASAQDPTVEQCVFAQSAGSQSSVTTAGTTTTNGNTFIVAVSAFSNIIGATPVTDSKSNTYAAAVGSTGSTEGWVALYYVSAGTGGASHTFTFTPSSAGFIAIAACEVSGLATSSPVNETDGDASSGTSHTTGPITASAGIRELFVAAGSSSDSGVNFVHDTAWNWRGVIASGSQEGILIAWQTVPAAGSRSFTFTTPGNDFDAAVIAGFKAATAGGGGGETSHPFIAERSGRVLPSVALRQSRPTLDWTHLLQAAAR